MKVIAFFDFIISPFATTKGDIKEGEIYTVKAEHRGYSTFGKRWVDSYEFYETEGFWEKGIFIPLSNTEELKVEKMQVSPIEEL